MEGRPKTGAVVLPPGAAGGQDVEPEDVGKDDPESWLLLEVLWVPKTKWDGVVGQAVLEEPVVTEGDDQSKAGTVTEAEPNDGGLKVDEAAAAAV